MDDPVAPVASMKPIQSAFLFIFALVSALLAIPASAGPEDVVKDIRQHYQYVKNGLEQTQNEAVEEKGAFYSNELLVNRHRNAWPGSGIYQERLTFWYDESPEITALRGLPASHALQMVVVSTQAAARVFYAEYLYRDGQCVFVFQKSDESAAPEEFRAYFENESLVRVMEGANMFQLSAISAEQRGRADAYLKDARRFQRLFGETFGLQ